MSTYDEAKLNAFNAVTTVTVVGVPLVVADSHSLKSEGYQPIKGCICVIPPYKYNEGLSKILWIFSPRGDVKGIITNKKNEAGEELFNFRLDIDTTIVIESYERIRVSNLLDNVQHFGTSHQKSLLRASKVPTDVLNQITIPNQFNLGLRTNLPKCPPTLLSSSPDGSGLGVWVLTSENAETCTYQYTGGIA